MEIKRIGSQPSAKGRQSGSLGWFVLIRFFRHPIPPLFKGLALRSSRARELHGTHPLGQTLNRHGGLRLGSARRWTIEEIRPVTWSGSRPARKHWHGATQTTAMTHIAIQEKKDGKVVDWMEQVTSEQYRK